MPIFTTSQRRTAQTISDLAHCNPFLPERIELERAALGDAFTEHRPDWNLRPDDPELHPNVLTLKQTIEELLAAARSKLAGDATPAEGEADLYEDLVLFHLYQDMMPELDAIIAPAVAGAKPTKSPAKLYDRFARQAESLFSLHGVFEGRAGNKAHLFAILFQVRRAFHTIFHYLIGGSPAGAALRAAVWQSIFTHDPRRYRRALYNRMDHFTTLVIGPSGSGKELVAQAVGLSRYIAFDEKTKTFEADFTGAFFPLNLSALSPTLIESELFGHKRGSFTGAVAERTGYLEQCPPSGAVFLDEIGDLDPAIQVKLLRVIQQRTFTKLGETVEQPFHGKLIAATNRDLAQQIAANNFREDFYYRLCSDIITTPSLRQRLAGAPDELDALILHLAERLVGADEAGQLAEETQEAIAEHLPPDYPWPGNIRELEQCLRNVVIRRSYTPPAHAFVEASAKRVGDVSGSATPVSEHGPLFDSITRAELTAEELLSAYCKIAHDVHGGYEPAARVLELDRRTIKAKINS